MSPRDPSSSQTGLGWGGTHSTQAARPAEAVGSVGIAAPSQPPATVAGLAGSRRARHVAVLLQVFARAGMVKSCSVSRKKNKSGIARELSQSLVLPRGAGQLWAGAARPCGFEGPLCELGSLPYSCGWCQAALVPVSPETQFPVKPSCIGFFRIRPSVTLDHRRWSRERAFRGR